MSFLTPSKYKVKVSLILLTLVVCLDIGNSIISYGVNFYYKATYKSQIVESLKPINEKIAPFKDKLVAEVKEGELSLSDIYIRRVLSRLFIYYFVAMVFSYLFGCIIAQLKEKQILNGE